MKAGVARMDITPAAGIPLTGFLNREGPSIGVRDPLYARALVLDDGERQAAVVVCDLLALDRHFVASARASIEDTTGIPGENIMIATTHTHSGPATIVLRDCGDVDASYLRALRQRLVEVTRAAAGDLREAQMGAGSGRVVAGVQNRREPGGPIDPELGVVRVDDEHGPMAIVLNYACHPVCLGPENRHISADYPGRAVQVIEEQTGALALFITGAAGNVNPAPDERRLTGAQRLGSRLAAEALRVVTHIPMAGPHQVTVASETLDLPLQAPPSAADLEEMIGDHLFQIRAAQEASSPLRAKWQRALLGWAQATLGAIRKGCVGQTVPAEVQVIGLGDVALVGIPGELFVELGLDIKERSAPTKVLVCGYANGDIGYIPTREAYSQGGYEIEEAFKFYGYPAALAPEAGERLVQAASTVVMRSREKP